MKTEQHIEHCKQALGQGFPEVHEFLDQYHEQLGPIHRTMLHNPTGVVQCIIEWGMLAGAAACLHIWADEVGLIQTNDGKFEPAPEIGKYREIERTKWKH